MKMSHPDEMNQLSLPGWLSTCQAALYSRLQSDETIARHFTLRMCVIYDLQQIIKEWQVLDMILLNAVPTELR